jgi:hypothetical protein
LIGFFGKYWIATSATSGKLVLSFIIPIFLITLKYNTLLQLLQIF